MTFGSCYETMQRSAKFQTSPNAVDCFDLVKACEGVFLFVFSRSDCHLTI